MTAESPSSSTSHHDMPSIQVVRGGTGCDLCGAPVTYRCYASYNADHGENVHPLHARYPGAMYRSCAEHLGELLMDEPRPPLNLPPHRQWLVVRPCSPDELDEPQSELLRDTPGA